MISQLANLGLVMVIVFLVWYALRALGKQEAEHQQALHTVKARYSDELARCRGMLEVKVDPWAMQAKLMEMSCQEQPSVPTLTKAGLLYAALIMEEGGETFRALCSILHHIRTDNEDEEPFDVTASCLDQVAVFMDDMSKRIRDDLREQPELRVALNEGTLLDLAVEVFDGTTDIAVVNSGFALAMGLPAAEGYRDVAGSNLSKANPDTGVIDKDPSGKWIKGRNYTAPDLQSVLMIYTPTYDADSADY